MSKPVIAMVGLGYVGLSTAVAFASRGMHVTGYDVDESKVAQINSGEPTFYEPKVRTLLRTSLKRGFVARNTLGPADVYFVTVGTPSLPNGSIDLTFVKDASREIGRVLKNMAGYQLLVIRSTVLPGTTLGVVRPAVESESGRRVGDELGLAMNPEF